MVSQKFLPKWLPVLLLAVLLGMGLWLTRPDSLRIKWADETYYYTVGMNISRSFDFNSHHYLSESIVRKGYPTKDTHTPGFPLLLALGFTLGGVRETTAFIVNYALLAATLLLIFLTGKKLGSPGVGLAACSFFLIYPMTMPLTHSIMSEPAAAAAIAAIAAALFLLPEGMVKGILLAVTITMAGLIKPFLAAFLLPCVLVLWLKKKPGTPRTYWALGLALALLGFFVVVPLTSNREYYPYPGTEIFSQATWQGKISRTFQNLKSNANRFLSLKWREGEGMTTISMGLLWIFTLGLFIRNRMKAKTEEKAVLDSFSLLLLFTIAAFLPITAALFLFYEYHSLRGIRALSCFSPLLSLLITLGIFNLIKQGGAGYSRRLAVALTLAATLAVFLGGSTYLALREFRKSQAFQFRLMATHFTRLQRFLLKNQLNPDWVVSRQNFFLPIARYPAKLIWLPPASLKELRKIGEKVPIDLLELKENEPLVRENRRIQGNDASLSERYILIHQGYGYLYYVPVAKSL